MKRGAFKKIFQKPAVRVLLATAVVFVFAFALYLRHLYHQLDSNFQAEEEFIPTRVYSDVWPIRLALERPQVESRLKQLNYRITSSDRDSLQFSLRPQDYPNDLFPPGTDPVWAGKPVRLEFDSTVKPSTLTRVTYLDGANWTETEAIYLEPELIATLTRSDRPNLREIRKVLTFEDIPAPIWQAIISVEDPRFLEHAGLDPRGILRAIWVNLRTGSLAQGGSTITAQLVKNLMERRTRNLFRKFNELFLALILEMRYTKEEILTRYLNEVYLGQVGGFEVHGVAEGAELFYKKDLSELNLGEISLMAGLIRGPGFYSPYRHLERAKERQKFVLKRMIEAGYIAEEEAISAEKQSLRFAPPVTQSNRAPYFTDYVKAELIRKLKDAGSTIDITTAGLRVYTTLDPVLSELAQTSVNEGVANLEKQWKIDSVAHPEQRLEGALATVDHTTGYIRALVGGKSYQQSTFNRILNMKRQVGSTFKPFVYLTAFLKGKDDNGVAFSTDYPVLDRAWTLKYDSGRQTWSPRNYDPGFLGWIPLHTASAKSINTVASRLGVSLGIPSIIDTARMAGITGDLPNVPSLTLGVAELSPVELLSAYATIAHFGVQDELTVIRSILKSDGSRFAHFVFEPKEMLPRRPTALLMKLLTYTFQEGTAAPLSNATKYTIPSAGKTGTTSSYRDAWFAGFTPKLTTVVWVGADQSGEPKKIEKGKKPAVIKLTGAGSALPIWMRFMREAHRGVDTPEFDFSDDLREERMDKNSGFAPRPECPESQVIQSTFHMDALPGETACEPEPKSIPETIEQ